MIDIHNTTPLAISLNEEDLSAWIEQQCSEQSIEIESIGIVLVGDEALLEMNKKHLNHNYYTDILTFDYREAAGPLDAELYISLDRVKDNSLEHLCSFEDELLRVVAHGLLHLMGMEDVSERGKQSMRQEETRWIEAFNVSRGTSTK